MNDATSARLSRRTLLISGLGGAAFLLVPSRPSGIRNPVVPVADVAPFPSSPALAKFVVPLRGLYPLDPSGIPVAIPDGTRKYLGGKLVVDHYTIGLSQFTDVLHPDLGSTTLWGYHSAANLGGPVPQRHLGGILIGHRGKPIQLTFSNSLPNQHPLPVDISLMGADDPVNRASVHLHGGVQPWISDGGPYTWFRPSNGQFDAGPFYGPSAAKGSLNVFKVLNSALPVGQAEYYLPLDQSARMLWYHDHAIGTTRLNAYAGLASVLVVRDTFERSLITGLGLPDYAENGGRELVLVIQEKIFLAQDDPSFPGSARTKGSLWYPYQYDLTRWASDPGKDPSTLPISVIPEMFGDTMLINGVVHPKVAVEPRRYRLRILNATQARFLNLQLYAETTAGSGLPDFTRPGPDFLVIGTEGGFLAHPVVVPSGRRLNGSGEREVDPAAAGGSLLTAPAERWDVVVDFSAFAGSSLLLYNDAPAPFPAGDPVNDGTVLDDGTILNQRIMRFDVAATASAAADAALKLTGSTALAGASSSGIDPALVGSWAANTTAPLAVPAGVTVRQLTLNEIYDAQGRLIQMLGTNKFHALPTGFTLPVDDSGALPAGAPLTAATGYADAATETAALGAVEVWQVANLTGDVHPMHFHLVNVQVLSRQPFGSYLVDSSGVGTPQGLGAARGPDATELGWKETVRMNPGEVTTVAMKFTLPAVPFAVPASPRTGGNEFVWHCHILEHEEHDMMRPLIVSGQHPRLA
jgi:spore coat protein A, manganese oxidase